MKVSYTKVRKEFNAVRKLLDNQQKERKKILSKIPHLKKAWRSAWEWDEEPFFDDCAGRFDYLVDDLEQRGVSFTD